MGEKKSLQERGKAKFENENYNKFLSYKLL